MTKGNYKIYLLAERWKSHPQKQQDELQVRFVFMTAQSLNTIAEEEHGLADTSLGLTQATPITLRS